MAVGDGPVDLRRRSRAHGVDADSPEGRELQQLVNGRAVHRRKLSALLANLLAETTLEKLERLAVNLNSRLDERPAEGREIPQIVRHVQDNLGQFIRYLQIFRQSKGLDQQTADVVRLSTGNVAHDLSALVESGNALFSVFFAQHKFNERQSFVEFMNIPRQHVRFMQWLRQVIKQIASWLGIMPNRHAVGWVAADSPEPAGQDGANPQGDEDGEAGPPQPVVPEEGVVVPTRGGRLVDDLVTSEGGEFQWRFAELAERVDEIKRKADDRDEQVRRIREMAAAGRDLLQRMGGFREVSQQQFEELRDENAQTATFVLGNVDQATHVEVEQRMALVENIFLSERQLLEHCRQFFPNHPVMKLSADQRELLVNYSRQLYEQERLQDLIQEKSGQLLGALSDSDSLGHSGLHRQELLRYLAPKSRIALLGGTDLLDVLARDENYVVRKTRRNGVPVSEPKEGVGITRLVAAALRWQGVMTGGAHIRCILDFVSGTTVTRENRVTAYLQLLIAQQEMTAPSLDEYVGERLASHFREVVSGLVVKAEKHFLEAPLAAQLMYIEHLSALPAEQRAQFSDVVFPSQEEILALVCTESSTLGQLQDNLSQFKRAFGVSPTTTVLQPMLVQKADMSLEALLFNATVLQRLSLIQRDDVSGQVLTRAQYFVQKNIDSYLGGWSQGGLQSTTGFVLPSMPGDGDFHAIDSLAGCLLTDERLSLVDKLHNQRLLRDLFASDYFAESGVAAPAVDVQVAVDNSVIEYAEYVQAQIEAAGDSRLQVVQDLKREVEQQDSLLRSILEGDQLADFDEQLTAIHAEAQEYRSAVPELRYLAQFAAFDKDQLQLLGRTWEVVAKNQYMQELHSDLLGQQQRKLDDVLLCSDIRDTRWLSALARSMALKGFDYVAFEDIKNSIDQFHQQALPDVSCLVGMLQLMSGLDERSLAQVLTDYQQSRIFLKLKHTLELMALQVLSVDLPFAVKLRNLHILREAAQAQPNLLPIGDLPLMVGVLTEELVLCMSLDAAIAVLAEYNSVVSPGSPAIQSTGLERRFDLAIAVLQHKGEDTVDFEQAKAQLKTGTAEGRLLALFKLRQILVSEALVSHFSVAVVTDISRVVQAEVSGLVDELLVQQDFAGQLRSFARLVAEAERAGCRLVTPSQLLLAEVKKHKPISGQELANIIDTYAAQVETPLSGVLPVLQAQPADPQLAWRWALEIKVYLGEKSADALDVGEQAVIRQVEKVATTVLGRFHTDQSSVQAEGLIMPRQAVKPQVGDYIEAMLFAEELPFSARLQNLKVLAAQSDLVAGEVGLSQLIDKDSVAEDGQPAVSAILVAELSQCKNSASALRVAQEFMDCFPELTEQLTALKDIAVIEKTIDAMAMLLQVQRVLGGSGSQLGSQAVVIHRSLTDVAAQEMLTLKERYFSSHANLGDSIRCLQRACQVLPPAEFDAFYQDVELPKSLLTILRSESRVFLQTERMSPADIVSDFAAIHATCHLIQEQLDPLVGIAEGKVADLVATIVAEKQDTKSRVMTALREKVQDMSDAEMTAFVDAGFKRDSLAWFNEAMHCWPESRDIHIHKFKLLCMSKFYHQGDQSSPHGDAFVELAKQFPYRLQKKAGVGDPASQHSAWYREAILMPAFRVFESDPGSQKFLQRLREAKKRLTAGSPSARAAGGGGAALQLQDLLILHEMTPRELSRSLSGVGEKTQRQLDVLLALDGDGELVGTVRRTNKQISAAFGLYREHGFEGDLKARGFARDVNRAVTVYNDYARYLCDIGVPDAERSERSNRLQATLYSTMDRLVRAVIKKGWGRITDTVEYQDLSARMQHRNKRIQQVLHQLGRAKIPQDKHRLIQALGPLVEPLDLSDLHNIIRAQAELEKSKGDARALEAELKELDQQVDRLRSSARHPELDVLHSRLRSLESARAGLDSEIAVLTRDRKNSDTELHALNESIKLVERNIGALEKDLNRLQVYQHSELLVLNRQIKDIDRILNPDLGQKVANKLMSLFVKKQKRLPAEEIARLNKDHDRLIQSRMVLRDKIKERVITARDQLLADKAIKLEKREEVVSRVRKTLKERQGQLAVEIAALKHEVADKKSALMQDFEAQRTCLNNRMAEIVEKQEEASRVHLRRYQAVFDKFKQEMARVNALDGTPTYQALVGRLVEQVRQLELVFIERGTGHSSLQPTTLAVLEQAIAKWEGLVTKAMESPLRSPIQQWLVREFNAEFKLVKPRVECIQKGYSLLLMEPSAARELGVDIGVDDINRMVRALALKEFTGSLKLTEQEKWLGGFIAGRFGSGRGSYEGPLDCDQELGAATECTKAWRAGFEQGRNPGLILDDVPESAAASAADGVRQEAAVSGPSDAVSPEAVVAVRLLEGGGSKPVVRTLDPPKVYLP
jgi:hypothetical protein